MTVNLCKWTIPPAFVLLFIQKSSKLITISPEMNEHNKLWGTCEVVMDFNSRIIAVYLYTGPYMETTSQVLVLRHSMVSVDPSRGGNYNVVTTSRLFFTQLSNILFQVVSEWQTQTCITWVITWSMEATNEFSPDPLTLWLYFAPWTVWIYLVLWT